MNKNISFFSILGCILICFLVALLHSCETSEGGATHIYVYKNESSYRIKIEKYRDGVLVGTQEIPQFGSIDFMMRTGQGETLINSTTSIRVIFDTSKELWFKDEDHENSGNIYNPNSYESINPEKFKHIHTYTFADEHYNMATPIQ